MPYTTLPNGSDHLKRLTRSVQSSPSTVVQRWSNAASIIHHTDRAVFGDRLEERATKIPCIYLPQLHSRSQEPLTMSIKNLSIPLLLMALLHQVPSVIAQSPQEVRVMTICESCTARGLMSDGAGVFTAVTGEPDRYYAWTSTNDGADWKRSEGVLPIVLFQRVPNSHYDVWSESTQYMHLRTRSHVTRDAGSSWVSYSVPGVALAQEFIAPDSGYRIMAMPNGFEIRGSFDSNFIFIERISEWTTSEPGLQVRTARILSKDRVIVSILLGSSSFLLSTIDGGMTWTQRPILEPTPYGVPYFDVIASTTNPDRFYAIGGLGDSTDFVRTTDGGQTWKEYHDRAPGRIMRIVETSPESMWILVNRKVTTDKNELTFYLEEGHIADSLFFSSDGGDTWLLQSSVVGDTVADIVADENGRLHVLSLRNGSTILRTFSSGFNSVERSRFKRDADLRLHPNPSSDFIRFVLDRRAKLTVRIVDPLGRVYLEDEVEVQPHVPSTVRYPETLDGVKGCLLLVLDDGSIRSSQAFVKY